MEDWDRGSETGSKSVGIALIVNTEAWDRVLKSFKDFDKVLNTGIEAVKPLVLEAARKEHETMEQFRREQAQEWTVFDNYMFDGGARSAKLAAMEYTRRREEEHASVRAIFANTPLSFYIQSEPVKTLKELLDEVNSEGLFPELQVKLDEVKIEQKLHKKKNKRVKNWEHNKHWQGRK